MTTQSPQNQSESLIAGRNLREQLKVPDDRALIVMDDERTLLIKDDDLVDLQALAVDARFEDVPVLREG